MLPSADISRKVMARMNIDTNDAKGALISWQNFAARRALGAMCWRLLYNNASVDNERARVGTT